MSPVSWGLHWSWESSRDRPKINLMERRNCKINPTDAWRRSIWQRNGRVTKEGFT